MLNQVAMFTLAEHAILSSSDLDFFETPFPVLDAIFSGRVIPRLHAPRILDTGAADGRWGNYAANYFTGVEALHGVEYRDVTAPLGFTDWYRGDFLTMALPAPYDVIVGNPPFNQAGAFVLRSLSLLAPGGSLFYLLKVQFLGSANRYDNFWPGTPLAHVYYSVDRIGFLKHKNTEEV